MTRLPSLTEETIQPGATWSHLLIADGGWTTVTFQSRQRRFRPTNQLNNSKPGINIKLGAETNVTAILYSCQRPTQPMLSTSPSRCNWQF